MNISKKKPFKNSQDSDKSGINFPKMKILMTVILSVSVFLICYFFAVVYFEKTNVKQENKHHSRRARKTKIIKKRMKRHIKLPERKTQKKNLHHLRISSSKIVGDSFGNSYKIVSVMKRNFKEYTLDKNSGIVFHGRSSLWVVRIIRKVQNISIQISSKQIAGTR